MKIERNNLGIGQHRLYRKTLADTNSAWCMQQAMVLAKTQPMSSGFLPTLALAFAKSSSPKPVHFCPQPCLPSGFVGRPVLAYTTPRTAIYAWACGSADSFPPVPLQNLHHTPLLRAVSAQWVPKAQPPPAEGFFLEGAAKRGFLEGAAKLCFRLAPKA